MREPILNETDASPRRRARRSLSSKKVFFTFFILRTPDFFF
jgi:hypothetical protein